MSTSDIQIFAGFVVLLFALSLGLPVALTLIAIKRDLQDRCKSRKGDLS